MNNYDPNNNYQQPVYSQPAAPQPNILTFGILSLVFGTVLAIIFGAIGRSKGKNYIAQGGTLTGSAKVGYILSLVGLILGIVSTVIVAIIIITGGAATALTELN